MIDFSSVSINMGVFVAGFSVAVIAFYDEIRLGVQIKREARKKTKEMQTQ
jgi:hypothetical protein